MQSRHVRSKARTPNRDDRNPCYKLIVKNLKRLTTKEILKWAWVFPNEGFVGRRPQAAKKQVLPINEVPAAQSITLTPVLGEEEGREKRKGERAPPHWSTG